MDRGQILGSAITMMWRLVLLGAMALFVALTVGTAFTANQDVRQAEASILAHRITDCIAREGIVNPKFDLRGCFVPSDEIYVGANLTSYETNFSRFAESGSRDINVFCRIKSQSGESYPSCIMERKYSVLIDNKKMERGFLEISIGIKKYGQNV